jgi:N-acetylmuramic acid 6-phosphate etherase
MQNLTTEEFLKKKSQFKLGNLVTESFHEKSKKLSSIQNISEALDIFKEIDVDAINIISHKCEQAFKLKEAIRKTFENKKRVYICGCGATGRLALSLEFLFREKFNTDQVVSFMAGGDYALIKSVEKFEDRPEYGKRQLIDLGFSDGDLLISITEGGETSFVIGASNAACEISKNNGYFLYCNPDEELKLILRSKEIIENDNIHKINLTVGAMTISGSTRMQATTVQMFFSGLAILNYNLTHNEFENLYNTSIEQLINLDYAFLEPFIKKEYDVYKEQGHTTYKVDKSLAICALTDTTERSPTFSLRGFEKLDEEMSLCFLSINNTSDSKSAWWKCLNREPRCLDWNDITDQLSTNELLKFDISEKSIVRRSSYSKGHDTFFIDIDDRFVYMKLDKVLGSFKHNGDLLITHLKLKLLLNTLSTLVMKELGRIESNVMSYVRPSNLKLIDRATRYVVELSKDNLTYEQALKRVINNMKDLKADESVVVKSLKD